MSKNFTFFERFFTRGHAKKVGGYASHTPAHLLAWVGLGCLGLTIAGFILFMLVLSIGFQVAKMAFPQDGTTSMVEVSKSWLEQQFSNTQNKVSALEKQVTDLTQEIDMLQGENTNTNLSEIR